MRSWMPAVCAIALSLSLAQRAEAVTVVQTATWNGHTYIEVRGDGHAFVRTQAGGGDGTGISWTDAEAYAVSVGGHLATITSAAENTWIFDTFNSGAADNLWIGLSKPNGGNSSSYDWSNPSEDFVLGSSYNNFHPEINSFNAGAGAVYVTSGDWGATAPRLWGPQSKDVTWLYDTSVPSGPHASDDYFHAIIEIDGVVPEPASLLLVAGAAGAALVRRSHRRA